MARKPKVGRPTTGRDDITVKVDRDVARKLKFIASEQRRTIAEIVSEQIKPYAEKMYAQLVKEL